MNKFIFYCGLLALLTACGGSDSEDTDPVTQQLITGTLFDSQNGSALSGATVSTLPATEEVTSRDDGSYTLRNLINADNEYEVLANKLGYRPDRARVSVAPNSTTTADFQLDPIVNGLAVSINTINFTLGTDRKTFLLTSTVPNTGFTIQAADAWLTATPSQGNISSSENKIIALNIDRSLLTGDRAATQLIINTSNGTDGVVMDITVDVTVNSSGSGGETGSDAIGGGTNSGSNSGSSNNSGTEGSTPEPAVGLPGSVVDCQLVLPCTWISIDSAYEFIVRYSDGMGQPPNSLSLGSGEPYTVVYEFKPRSNDTTVVFLGDSNVLTSSDTTLSTTRIINPESSGLQPASFFVFQNTGLRIRHYFNQEISGTGSMKRVNVHAVVNNQAIQAQFDNVPFGREPSTDAECNFTLPCTWESEDAQHSVTITDVTVDPTTKYLNVEFTATTQSFASELTIDFNSTASGNNLILYQYYTYRTLGSTTSFNSLVTEPAQQGVPLSGNIEFREQEVDISLQNLSRLQIHLYENLGLARLWNPIWFNLPLSE